MFPGPVHRSYALAAMHVVEDPSPMRPRACIDHGRKSDNEIESFGKLF